MALQVEIEFGRVNHIAIHDCTSGAIPAPIRVPGVREKANMMAFADDNDGNLRSYSYFLASL